ncbi:MAG TPA: nitroreductase family deazaflavin-dependent oxidoreductase [Acidimicrobiales bacterium]|nr:nitroreductase family deazaflavin-dependent oxidoreductase [Acidimicrobiales bacterium]
MSPRYSESRGRQITRLEDLAERAAMSRVGYQYLLHVAPVIDRVVIPRTEGRWSSAGKDLVGMVTTTGAKSGLPRPQPLVCIPENDDTLLLIGSNYGRAHHPSWVYNLSANSHCTVTFRGTTRDYDANELDGDERRRAWDRAVDW